MGCELEMCCECDLPTGRAGKDEDSLYTGDFGPYCEECWGDVPEKLAQAIRDLQAQLAEAYQYAHEATKAITGLTVGGSEFFAGKLGPYYKADLEACVSHVRDRQQRQHEMLIATQKKRRDLQAQNAKLREALEWYGAQARLARLIHSEGDIGRMSLAADGGKRAIAALEDTP